MNQSVDRPEPYALPRDGGPAVDVGVRFVIKASERDGGGCGVLEYVTRKGEEPGEHTHPTEDEMFYVVTGSLTFHCRGKDFDVDEGGFVFLPRGVPHGYTVRGDGPVRLLAITAPPRDHPGGWGGFIGEMEAAS